MRCRNPRTQNKQAERPVRALWSKDGGVAQLGEHQAGSLRVRGSNPLASTIMISKAIV